MFSYITGESNKIGFGMLPGVADFPSAHLKRRCLIVSHLVFAFTRVLQLHRAAAYQALTRPTVTRTAPLVWPSHFKGLETEASDPSPSFKFSLPDKIKVPEFRSNSSGKTQNASSNSPSDPEASSNNKIPVIFRFSSPTPSSQISSKAVPDRTSSKFPFPSICPWFFKSTANPVSTLEVTASSVSVDAVKPSDTGNIFSSLLSRHPASPHLHNEPMNSSDEPIFGKSLNILKENC